MMFRDDTGFYRFKEVPSLWYGDRRKKHWLFKFDNGFGVSIIQTPTNLLDDMYDLVEIVWIGNDYKIDMSTYKKDITYQHCNEIIKRVDNY